jgi:hypothetical protein
MGSLAPMDKVGAVFMARSVWSPIGFTGSGPSMPESPTISKKMVAYLESFLGVAPFRKPVIDTRIDKMYADAMRRLAKVPEKEYVNYLARKLEAWYTRFPPKAVDPADKADEAAVEHGSADEANGGADPVEGLELSDAE